MTKGNIIRNLASIRQAPVEHFFFQNYIDRLLKTISKAFGDSQAGNTFVKQLAYENANAACCVTILPNKAHTDLAQTLCTDWAFVQSRSSHGYSFARNHSTSKT